MHSQNHEIAFQSRDCTANLEIVQHACAISRSRDLHAQSANFGLSLTVSDLLCSSKD